MIHKCTSKYSEWLQSEIYAAGIRQAVTSGIDKWQVTKGYLDSKHKEDLNNLCILREWHYLTVYNIMKVF